MPTPAAISSDVIADFSAWFGTMWIAFAVLGFVLAISIAILIIRRARTRAREQVPQYRRLSKRTPGSGSDMASGRRRRAS